MNIYNDLILFLKTAFTVRGIRFFVILYKESSYTSTNTIIQRQFSCGNIAEILRFRIFPADI